MISTYSISTWLFLRVLGLIYLAAFASLAVQVKGLIGRNGISPAEEFLEEQRRNFRTPHFVAVPTLCWLKPNDGFLQFLCWGGVGLSVLLTAGIAPGPTLVLLWSFYLSLLNVSGVFLSYQWDALLLETGFLSMWLAPWDFSLHCPPDREPNRFALWMAWWLLFRLMFSSGVVKTAERGSDLATFNRIEVSL
jgi:lipase maturation factor 1